MIDLDESVDLIALAARTTSRCARWRSSTPTSAASLLPVADGHLVRL